MHEAFSVGGPALLVQLVENLSGLRIDNYVAVDFAGFKHMVDALGGVTLCVNTTRHDPDSGDMLTNGVHQNVTGDDALAFVRDRKGLPNGDLDRIRDQQYFLAQMLTKVTSAGTLANPLKLNAFLTAATGNVTVDQGLGVGNLRTLATRLRHLDAGHVTFETIPITTDGATRSIHGVEQSVVLIDRVKASALFGQLRTTAAGNPPSAAPSPPTKISVAPAQVRLSVLSGSERAGLAAQAAAQLRQDGFAVVRVGNTVPTDHTVVRYRAGREDAARTAAAVPGASLVARRQRRLGSRPVRCAYASQPTSRPHCQLSAVVRYGPIALCADCDARRSTLGKGITPHRLPPQPPLDVLDWIASADAAVHQAHTELAAAVARARARQHSWAVIGAVLHTSRQAAQQRFGQDLPVER